VQARDRADLRPAGRPLRSQRRTPRSRFGMRCQPTNGRCRSTRPS